jgi:hypothetical protein
MSFRRQTTSLIRNAGGGSVALTDRSAAVESTWSQAEIPELRRGTSETEIVLGRYARSVILGDLFVTSRSDGLEAGGFLFAKPVRSWDTSSVEIVDATPTGNALRRSDSLRLDNAEWTRAERTAAANGFDQVLSGLWHSHGDTRDATPSDTDLRAWLAALDWGETNGRSTAVSVGLIYSASTYYGDTYARPRIHGWVVRREGYGRRAICEPAVVRERY